MQSNLQKALNRCYYFLKFRPRTEKEVINFLYKKSKKYKLNTKSILDLVKELKSKEYINDKNFIEWFVLKKSTKKPTAAFLIKRELRAYGIKDNDIEEYFEKNKFDEYTLAKNLLTKYWFKLSTLDFETKRMKIQNLLLRRGFNNEIIKKAIEEFEKNE